MKKNVKINWKDKTTTKVVNGKVVTVPDGKIYFTSFSPNGKVISSTVIGNFRERLFKFDK